MQDYWNDPPDDMEPPECCGDIMECDDDGGCHCLACGAVIEPPTDPEPDWEGADYDPGPNTCRTCGKPTECFYCSDECTPDCPHGNRPDDCAACDFYSDLAADAWRENR